MNYDLHPDDLTNNPSASSDPAAEESVAIESEGDRAIAPSDRDPKRETDYRPVGEAVPQRGLSNWKAIAIGVGAGVLLATLGGRLLSGESSDAPPAATETERTPSQTVTAATVEAQSVSRTLSATGTVVATDLLPILPQITGLQIVDVRVEEGDVVNAGEVLAVLDNSVLQAQLSGALSQVDSASASVDAAVADISQAEAARRQAQADLERARTGVEQARSRVVQAEANRDRARSAVEQARANLDQAEAENRRYQQLAREGAISQQEADFRRTDVRTAREELNKALEDVRVAEAEIQSARADVTNARANVTSAQATLESTRAGIDASQAGVGNAEAGVQNQAAVVQELETRIAQTRVTAPESGIVAERLARVGDVTSGSGTLFTLIAEGQLELQLTVPETELPSIDPGAAVRITSDADPSIDLNGRVREILPTLDPDTREAIVEVDLPRDDRLRPGMFLEGDITTDSVQGLTIPTEAVVPQADGTAKVFRLNPDNTVTAVTVEVGEVVGNENLDSARIEILSGLDTGDRVVASGAGYLKDGDLVRVVK